MVGLGFRSGEEYVVPASDASVSSLVGLADELLPAPPPAPPPVEVRSYDHPEAIAPSSLRRFRIDAAVSQPFPAPETTASVGSRHDGEVVGAVDVPAPQGLVTAPAAPPTAASQQPPADAEPMVSLAELRLPTAEEMVGSHQAPPEGAVVIDVPHPTQLPSAPQTRTAEFRWRKLLRTLGIRR